MGMAPNAIRARKGRMARCSGVWKPGCCGTTALVLAFGRFSDPRVTLPLQLFEMWLDILGREPQLVHTLGRAWELAVARLKRAKTRWLAVRSHLEAVVASLLDLGWEPLGPFHWRDTSSIRARALTDGK